MFTVRTDVNAARASAEPVKVEVVKAGGDIAFTASAKRGELVVVDAKGWPDGPYEVRAQHERTRRGLLYVTYLPWFKGDSLAMARALAADAARADDAEPARIHAEDAGRDGGRPARREDCADAKGNPWPKIHFAAHGIRRDPARAAAARRMRACAPAASCASLIATRSTARRSTRAPFCRRATTRRRSGRWCCSCMATTRRTRSYVRWWSIDAAASEPRHRVRGSPAGHLHRAARPRQYAVPRPRRQRRHARDRRGEEDLQRRREPRLSHAANPWAAGARGTSGRAIPIRSPPSRRCSAASTTTRR